MDKLSPILKWAGGKRQLLSEIIPRLPNSFKKYYEPFVGAGALLLEIQPKRAVINDTNTELINVYSIIKEQPYELIDLLKNFEKKHTKEFYYYTRDLDRNKNEFDKLSSLFKAARTIYLNRTCYNGLYRVNKQGYFNTPIGRNTSIRIVNEKGILGIHNYLISNNVTILNGDYKEAFIGIRKGDFVFLDPPYYPTNKDYFLRYDSSNFNVKKQVELKEYCNYLNGRGIKFIETNSNCDEIKDLYSQYNVFEVNVRRSINANADDRRGKELIICNY